MSFVFFFFAQEPHLGSNNSVLVKTRTAEAASSMTPLRDLLHFPLITIQFAVINGLISKKMGLAVVGYGSVCLGGCWDSWKHNLELPELGAAVF